MQSYIRKFKVFLIMLLLVFSSAQKGYPGEDKYLYYQGLAAARRGEKDSAFMYFDMLLKSYPKSKFFENTLFALGEYYFSISDSYDAGEVFRRLILQYPQSKTRPFVFVYLAKIARKEGKEDLAKNLEKEVIRFKHTSLLFKDFKEYKYVSGFSKKYKALYFIDKIEIYVNNELFAKIPL